MSSIAIGIFSEIEVHPSLKGLISHDVIQHPHYSTAFVVGYTIENTANL